MNKQAIALVLAVATLGTSTASFAQDWRGHRDHRAEQRHDRQDRREARRDAQEARRDMAEARRDMRHAQRDLQRARDDRRDHRFDNRHRPYPHAQVRPHFQRGGSVPVSYRAPQYVVHDWSARRLYAPPAGHQWVQVDNTNYVLMAVATGLIASVLLSR